jgi:hypothetical protein
MGAEAGAGDVIDGNSTLFIRDVLGLDETTRRRPFVIAEDT